MNENTVQRKLRKLTHDSFFSQFFSIFLFLMLYNKLGTSGVRTQLVNRFVRAIFHQPEFCARSGIFLCLRTLTIDVKIDNMDRVSMPTKIVATFDVEHPIHGTTYGVEQECVRSCMSVLSNLHRVELVINNIYVYVVNMQSSGYFVNIYRFGSII